MKRADFLKILGVVSVTPAIISGVVEKSKDKYQSLVFGDAVVLEPKKITSNIRVSKEMIKMSNEISKRIDDEIWAMVK